MATTDDTAGAERQRYIHDLLLACIAHCREVGREPPLLVVMAGAGHDLLVAGNTDERAIREAMVTYVSGAPERLGTLVKRRPFGPL